MASPRLKRHTTLPDETHRAAARGTVLRVWLGVAVVATILVFVPGTPEAFDGVKMAVVRVLGCGALAAGLVLVAQRRRPRAITPIDVAIGSWLLAETIATACSVAPRLSVVGEPVQREGWFTSVALAGLYAAGRLGLARREHALRILDLALGALAISSVYALVQAAKRDPIHWILPSTMSELRPCGTLGQANVFGALAAAAAVCAVVRLLTAARPRLLDLGALALFVAATLVTISRSAWLGLGVGIVAALVLALRARPDRRFARVALVVGGSVFLPVAAIVAGGWGGRLGARLAGMMHPMSGSGGSRYEIWRSAGAMWRERPWWGFGPDTFALAFPGHQTAAYFRFEWAGLPFHAHSIYLQVLATRGLVGFASAGFATVALGLAAHRAWRADPEARPLVAQLIAALLVLAVAGAFGAIGPAGALFVVLAAASLAALAAPPAMAAKPNTAARGTIAIATLVGVVIAALTSIRAAGDLSAARHVYRAQQLLTEARATPGPLPAAPLEHAVWEARRAEAASPWDDAGPRMLSEALVGAAGLDPQPLTRLDEAARAARRALAIVPTRVEGYEQLARARVAGTLAGARDDEREALAALERVVELAPRNPLLLDESARLALLLRRPDLATDWNARVTRLYPEWGAAQALRAQLAFARGDSLAGREALARAVSGDWKGDRAGRERALRSMGR